jgi:hypothetical protein
MTGIKSDKSVNINNDYNKDNCMLKHSDADDGMDAKKS